MGRNVWVGRYTMMYVQEVSVGMYCIGRRSQVKHDISTKYRVT